MLHEERRGVDNRGGKKQITAVGVGSKGGGEGGVGSRAGEAKGRTAVGTATKGIIVATAGEATLNFSITRVTFGESDIRLRDFHGNSVGDESLKWA